MIKWIENVNENNNDKNIINENRKININNIVRLLRTIIDIFNWKNNRNIKDKNIRNIKEQL